MALQQVEVILAGLRDTSGNVLGAGKVYTYAAGTLTPKAMYTDSVGSVAATNPIVLDSAGRAQVYAEGAYKVVVDDVNGATIYAWDNLYFARVTSATSQWPDIFGGTSTGSLSVYSITVPLTISGYTAGQEFRFISNHDTTGATATLNVNSQGAINLVKGPSNSALASGDIKNGDLVSVIYDSAGGGRFKVTSIAPSIVQTPLFLDRVNDRVGIGTTSPSSALSVEGTSLVASSILTTRYGANTSPTEVVLRKSRGATVGSNTTVVNGDSIGHIEFKAADGSSYPIAARIAAVVTDTVSSNVVPGALVIQTADSAGTLANRAKIDDRLVLVSDAGLSNTEEVRVQVQAALSPSGSRNAVLSVYKHSGITNPCCYLGLQEEDGGGAYYWTDNSGNARISSTLDHVGTTSGTVIGTQTSDERLKNVAGSVSYGLDAVAALEPVAFTMKDDPATPKIGFLAQQVQPIVPEAVYDTRELIAGEDPSLTKLAMDYSALIPVLVKALQELKARVEALEGVE